MQYNLWGMERREPQSYAANLSSEDLAYLRRCHKKDGYTNVLGCDFRAAQFRTPEGERVLQSYWTNVCLYTADGMFVRLWDDWSRTTMKHVQGFTGRWVPKKVWLRLPVGVPVDLDEEIERG